MANANINSTGGSGTATSFGTNSGTAQSDDIITSESLNFNYIAFAERVIDYLSLIQSDGTTGGQKAESKVNALYRMIGLPAVKEKSSKTGGIHRYNVFNVIKEPTPDTPGDKKYTEKLAKRDAGCNLPVSNEEASEFLNSSDYSFSSSIAENKSEKVKPRIRGTMFPLVVNGNIPIFPLTNRIAGAFMSKNDPRRMAGTFSMPSPLLETIILLSLQKDNVPVSTLSFENKVGFGYVISEVTNNIRGAILSPVILLEKTIREINRIKAKTSVNISSYVALSIKNNNIIGQDDLVAQKIKEKENSRSALITSSGIDTSGFVGIFLDAVVQKAGTKVEEREIKDGSDVERKNKDTVIKLEKELNYILGTFEGISGTDVLIIILALLSLSTSDLISLLNEESKENLRSVLGDGAKGIISSASNVSVESTISKLEGIVKDSYKALDSALQSKLSSK